MTVKMLALDMDGTTLRDDHHTLSPANRAALEDAVARGIIVVIATGRMRNRLPESVEMLAGLRYALTSNGAAVYDLQTGDLLYSNPLPTAVAARVLAAIEPLGVYAEAYCGGSSHVTKRTLALFDSFDVTDGRRKLLARNRFEVDELSEFITRPGVSVEKINLPFLPPESQAEVWARLRAIDDVTLTSSIAQNCEINARGASKADGLAHLCARLGVLPAEVMAMGDSGNDLEMMKFAGLSVAPANADPAVKAAAHFVTAAVSDADAVAEALARFLP